jgi:uncharacterized protein with von Willebrand factor type A (vWA) domain
MNVPSASPTPSLGFTVDSRILLLKNQLGRLEDHIAAGAAPTQAQTRILDVTSIDQLINSLKTEMEKTNSEMKSMKALLEDINKAIHNSNHRSLLQEQRANYQHQMLFNAVKKVAQDVKEVKGRMNSENEDVEIDGSPSLRSPGKTRATENRQNIERIMNHHLGTMQNTNNVKELRQAGDLAVKYADELFKSFLG